MSAVLVTMDSLSSRAQSLQQQYVTLRLGEQLFGVPVLAVQDVMRRQTIAPVPLAPSVVAGSLNVRGRIVTAIDMRRLMALGDYPQPEKVMKLVVEHQHDLYALIVDAVGDVMSLPTKNFDKVPTNLDASWRAVASGVFKLENELLVILDVGNIIGKIAEQE